LQQLDRDNLAVIVPYTVYLEAYTLILCRVGFGQAIAFTREIVKGANLINASTNDYLAATQLVSRFPDQQITLFDAVTAVVANA